MENLKCGKTSVTDGITGEMLKYREELIGCICVTSLKGWENTVPGDQRQQLVYLPRNKKEIRMNVVITQELVS